MKNQYFGDIGDYGKYGLLRFLGERGLSIAVNWYLTPDDVSNDGNIRGYLSKKKDRRYDPELYDALREMCAHEEKDVRLFAKRGMIHGANYHDDIVEPVPGSSLSVPEKRAARERWHRKALKACAGAELVFMDPDNGLRPGCPSARKDAPKFVYASEVCDYYDRDQDVVYYCHKGRRTDMQWERGKAHYAGMPPGSHTDGRDLSSGHAAQLHIYGASRKERSISEAAERLSGDGMEGLLYR